MRIHSPIHLLVLTAGLVYCGMPCAWAQAKHAIVSSLGGSSKHRFGSVGYALGWSPGFLKNLSLGPGIRTTVLHHDAREYSVPNASGLARDLRLETPAMLHANVAAFFWAEYRLGARWGLGLNIDLIGGSFGASRPAQPTHPTADFAGPVQASPSGVSALLYNTNDLGLLQSEFYITYKAAERVYLRAGLAHQHVQVTVTPAALETSRFAGFVNALMVGVAVPLGHLAQL